MFKKAFKKSLSYLIGSSIGGVLGLVWYFLTFSIFPISSIISTIAAVFIGWAIVLIVHLYFERRKNKR